jgi:hypothetical protein
MRCYAATSISPAIPETAPWTSLDLLGSPCFNLECCFGLEFPRARPAVKSGGSKASQAIATTARIRASTRYFTGISRAPASVIVTIAM